MRGKVEKYTLWNIIDLIRVSLQRVDSLLVICRDNYVAKTRRLKLQLTGTRSPR